MIYLHDIRLVNFTPVRLDVKQYFDRYIRTYIKLDVYMYIYTYIRQAQVRANPVQCIYVLYMF